MADKEIWVPVTATENGLMANIGDVPVCRLTATDHKGFTSFKVPADFSSLTSAHLIVIPHGSQAAANWDILSDYGAVGQSYDNHSESDTVTTYNVTDNVTFAIDISGILTSLAAGDYVGICLQQKHDDHDVYVVGVRLVYS